MNTLPESNTTEVVVTVAEYARMKRVSVSTVRRLCERNEIPGAKRVERIGDQWRITFEVEPKAA